MPDRVIEVVEYRRISNQLWASVRTTRNPAPTWWPLLDLVIR